MTRKIHADRSKKSLQLPIIPQIILDSSEKDKILNQWKNIPAIVEIADLTLFTALSQEVRSEIMDLLRIGIEEYDPVTKVLIVRHVFSAKEILSLIKSKVKTKLKLSNVYFHLNKLQEMGFIEPVVSIKKEGKLQSTAYFGRKARLFLTDPKADLDKFMSSEKIEPIIDILLELDQTFSRTELKNLMAQLSEVNLQAHEKIKRWIADSVNEEKIMKLNIDFRDIYTTLIFIYLNSQQPNESIVTLAKILNLQ